MLPPSSVEELVEYAVRAACKEGGPGRWVSSQEKVTNLEIAFPLFFFLRQHPLPTPRSLQSAYIA
jgi:hypothetical protein